MTRHALIVLALAGALVAVACAPSLGPDRPPPGRTPPPAGEAGPGAEAFSGGLVVQPFALLLTDFDADGDRRIAPEELEIGVAAAWRELDRDGDGTASALEFADWSMAVMGSENTIPGRVAFDRDAGGTISRAEFEAQIEEQFARLDADESGAVERAELVRFFEPATMMAGPQGGPQPFVLRRRAGETSLTRP